MPPIQNQVQELDYDPFQTHRADPYGLFARGRASSPVTYLPGLDMWAVTTREAILDVFRRVDDFSATNTNTPLRPACPEAGEILVRGGYARKSLFSSDPPAHTVARKAVREVLSPRRVTKLEPHIRSLVDSAIDSLVGETRAELMNALFYPIPALVILRLLGVGDDAEITSTIRHGSVDQAFLMYGPPARHQEEIAHASGAVAWWNFAHDLVLERSAHGRADDLTTDLINLRDDDGRPVFTTDEVTSLLLTFFSAGHDTTTGLLANGFYHLLRAQDQWQRLCEDQTLVPNAVEELLRYDTSIVTWRRRARRDTEVAGTKIPSGAHVLLLLGGANRDPGVFTHPDELQIDRGNAADHLSFGFGIHHCLGSSLARLEARVTTEQLARRIPSLRIAGDSNFEYMPLLIFRCAQRLDVEFDAVLDAPVPARL
jgi:cytochrome P450